MNMIVDTKFNFKQTVIKFGTKLYQKGYFQSKMGKVNHIRISLGSKFQLKLTVWIF